MPRFLAAIVAAAVLTGCAMAPTHDSKVAAPLAAAGSGNIAEALHALDANAGNDKAALLYNLERGELMRIDARFEESQAAFQTADVKVNEWEATAKTTPEKLMGQLGATFFGETFKTYEGQDYEKVMLTTRMAMNRISLGDLDTARVDIKRTHEREAVIMEFRAKETASAEEEAKSKGVTGISKELNGYPIETLNDPEVLELKNGYQNALSHYLAGFVYEALNEPGLAAAGYRKAIELRPNNPVLEEGLRGLDQRTSSARPRGVTDVLFVIEAGNAPARKSKQITFPIPTRNGAVMVPLTFPIIEPNRSALVIDQLHISDRAVPAALIADFNVMARRTLKDELPGVQFRAAIRAITKGVIQEQMNKQNPWLGLAGNIAAVVSESPADDRMWRSLPERVFLARAFLPPSNYSLRLPGTPPGGIALAVEGRHMLVPVRILENKTYFAQPTHFGASLPVLAAEPPPKAKRGEAPVAATANSKANIVTRGVKQVKATEGNGAAKAPTKPSAPAKASGNAERKQTPSAKTADGTTSGKSGDSARANGVKPGENKTPLPSSAQNAKPTRASTGGSTKPPPPPKAAEAAGKPAPANQ